MKAINGVSLTCVLALALVGAGHPAAAQQAITFEPVVHNAPYSAEGTTTITQTLGDGTRIERTTTTRAYRDGAGRERREQTVVGLAALNPSSESEAIVTIVDPVAGTAYTLDPRIRTARQMRLPAVPAMAANAPNQTTTRVMILRPPLSPPPPPPPPPPIFVRADAGREAPHVVTGGDVRASSAAEQSLGTRQIEGVAAIGTMTTSTIPVGRIGNDRPIEITDEQWRSTDLKVLVLSRHHDPRSGDVEYRLTNIVRAEPPPDLFAVPSDYTVVETPPPPPPPPAPGKPE
jgi:hypothetical protein